MLELDFPGVSMKISEEAAIIASHTALSTISSALVGGGFLQTHTIINYHVHKTYNHSDPASDLLRFAAACQIAEPFVGMMTAVFPRDTTTVTLRDTNLTVACILTAGLRVATAAGQSLPAPYLPGTINTIVLLDADLVPSALVNAIITATEAKTGLLLERGIRTEEGYAATGTMTDAVTIACTGRGAPLPYAGPGTQVGYLIGVSVRQCLSQAVVTEG